MADPLIRAPGATWHPSPNFGPRRGGTTPDMVVMHYTEMARCEDALARLCDPKAEVSAHYLISETGYVWQLVDEDMRAWHAGAGTWAGRDDVNSRSVGIELSNTGEMPFSEPQMVALEVLLRGILDRWRMSPAGVIAHSDMAPDRKIDPGPRFDWRRLALEGLSVWPGETGLTEQPFMASAKGFGYATSFGQGAVLHAFRQRFRPSFAAKPGPPDSVDRRMASNLAQRFGVDPRPPST